MAAMVQELVQQPRGRFEEMGEQIDGHALSFPNARAMRRWTGYSQLEPAASSRAEGGAPQDDAEGADEMLTEMEQDANAQELSKRGASGSRSSRSRSAWRLGTSATRTCRGRA